MPEISLIGKDTFKKEYKTALLSRGYQVKSFESLDTALKRFHEKTVLFIIEGKQKNDSSFKEFLRVSREIPKLIVSDTSYSGSLTPWIREPLTYHLAAPGVREFGYLVNSLLKRFQKEKELLRDYTKAKSDLSGAQHELNLYEEINKTITSFPDVEDVLPEIMKKAKNAIRAKSWSLFPVDAETKDLVFKKPGVRKARWVKMNPLEGIARRVAQKGVPVLIPDVSKDIRFYGKMWRSLRSKTKSFILVPIKSRGELLGVLEVENKTMGKPFTKRDLDLLMKFIDPVAIAIERASLHQKVAELTITDDLTKLFNREYLNRTIDVEIQRSFRYYTSVSLIFMDIDFFKRINDRYGHLVGSKVLVQMGQLLIKNLRSIDVVTRYGGDEFVIVLPQTSPRAAAQIAERIRRAIERKVFLKEEGYHLKITASFGIASFPESAKSKEELIRLADEAMYNVKHTTRDGVYAIV